MSSGHPIEIFGEDCVSVSQSSPSSTRDDRTSNRVTVTAFQRWIWGTDTAYTCLASRLSSVPGADAERWPATEHVLSTG